MSQTVFIYGLIDPITNELRYVGKSVNPQNRLRKHVSERNKHDSYKDRWLRLLFGKGLKPELIIIDEVSDENWMDWEIFYISYFKSIGSKLTNGTVGGDQPPTTKGRKHSEESKRKMSETKKGVSIPWLNNGSTRTEKHKTNLSKSLKGRTSEKKGISYKDFYGEEKANKLIEKLSLVHKGIQAGNKHPMFGKNHTKETKEKLSKKFTKPVLQKTISGELIERFNSAKEAEIKTGIPYYIIKYNCSGKNKKNNKFKWEYE